MNPFVTTFVFAAALAIAPAQEQATTLLAGCRTADVVVLAHVDAATDPSPDWHRLQFTTEVVLKGELAPTFALLEPAGACCGRSLFALQVGDRRLLFLRRTGTTLHPFGGDRGVVTPNDELLAHVQTLLLGADAASTTRTLAQALAATTPRIADDAAHALAQSAQLALDGQSRTRVAEALQAALEARHRRTAALVEVATRDQHPNLVDTLLTHYVESDATQAPLLRTALARCDSGLVTSRLPLHPGRGTDADLRTAELLAALPAEQATAPLQGLLRRSDCARARLCACQALLRFGQPASALQGSTSPAVLDVATGRQNARPRFRAIEPTRP